MFDYNNVYPQAGMSRPSDHLRYWHTIISMQVINAALVVFEGFYIIIKELSNSEQET